MLQDGQVADTPRAALLHARAARLASRTHDVGVSAFECKSSCLGPSTCAMTRNSGRPSNVSIPWKSLSMGSSFWRGVYPECCEESWACQETALSPWLSGSNAGLKLGEDPPLRENCSFPGFL